MKHPIRRRIMFLAFQGLRAIARVLPEAVLTWLGRVTGAVAYAVAPGLRRLTHQHLDQALGLPPAERRRVARQVYDNLGRTAMEWFWLPRLSEQARRRRVRLEGVEHLRAALAKGKGAIVLTAHFGNWEIVSLAIGLLGVPATALARRLRYPEYESYIVKMREAWGIRTLARGSLKEVASRLRNNEIVGVLPDQDVRTLEGIFVPFFGRPAHTLIGPAAMAVLTRAPLVPCFVVRDGRDFRFIVEPAIYPPTEAAAAPDGSPEALQRRGTKIDRAQAMQDLTVAWSAVVERYIRQHPGHWVWMHERWKTQPADTAVAPSTAADRPHPKPGLAIAAAVMALSLLGLGTAGCGPKMKGAGRTGPDQEMDTFTLSSFRADDTRKWELEGTGATIEGRIISVDRPNGVGYDASQSARLTAGVAMINQDTRHIRLEHEATIHTSDGLWFTSPVLYWMPDAHRFETDNPVRVETDAMLLRGRGAHGTTALKQATILRDVELVFDTGSNASPLGGSAGPGTHHATITCDGPMDFDYQRHIATFHTNVRVQDPAGDLYSDTLIAYLDPATRGIRYAEATGRVRIHQQQNVAHSDKAVYEPSKSKITLAGRRRPSLIVYPSGKAEPSLGLAPPPASSR